MATSLTDDEQLALIGLLRFATRLDGRTSHEELVVMQDVLREALASHDDAQSTPYRASPDTTAVDERILALEARADETFFDDDSVRRAALTVTRPAAREIIFAAVSDVALTHAMNAQETWLMDWLAENWGLTVETPEDETAQDEPG
jgi:hypothetical protein